MIQAPVLPLSSEPTWSDTSLLALLQGLTEFLPVSSSGHGVLMGESLGVAEQGMFLVIALHLGTLLSVLVVYRRDVALLLAQLVRGEPREAALLAIGTLPAMAVGLSLQGFFEERFADARSAAWGLVGTAAILAASEASRRRRARERAARPEPAIPPAGLRPAPRAVGFLDALWIGCAQAVAILPGVSRSGATIAAGMMRGLEPAQAARFSFLLSIPAILGAAAVTGAPLLSGERPAVDPVLVAWGVALAAMVGWAALRVLLAFLARGAFLWFAAYCAVLGLGYLLFN